MNKVIGRRAQSSAPPSDAMSAKSACNDKENIRSKKYAPDDVAADASKRAAQCPSPPVPGEDAQLSREPTNRCDETGNCGNDDKMKFVEAPLPKTNPWTANLSAAQVVRAKEPAREKDPVVGEKRVLQPQQQQAVGEYQYIPCTRYLCSRRSLRNDCYKRQFFGSSVTYK